MSEEWKVISEFPNYSVSSNGQIRHEKSQRIRKQQLSTHGYSMITFYSNNGPTQSRVVHRIVAHAFLSNPENKPCIDHINRIKTDNRVENLRWVTYSENALNLSAKETNKLHEKNIFYIASCSQNPWVVNKKLNGINHRAYFQTLEDAKAFRDGMEEFYS